MREQIDKNKRDAKRYRFIKRLATAWTGERDAYFSITIKKEFGVQGFGKPVKVINYRTLNGAVDYLMRKSNRRTR